MVTFKGNPNELVRLFPPQGNIRHIRFDGNGEYSTENPRLIARLNKKFEYIAQTPQEDDTGAGVTDDDKVYQCKKCDYTTPNKGELMAHYRAEHPKEG